MTFFNATPRSRRNNIIIAAASPCRHALALKPAAAAASIADCRDAHLEILKSPRCYGMLMHSAGVVRG